MTQQFIRLSGQSKSCKLPCGTGCAPTIESRAQQRRMNLDRSSLSMSGACYFELIRHLRKSKELERIHCYRPRRETMFQSSTTDKSWSWHSTWIWSRIYGASFSNSEVKSFKFEIWQTSVAHYPNYAAHALALNRNIKVNHQIHQSAFIATVPAYQRQEMFFHRGVKLKDTAAVS